MQYERYPFEDRSAKKRKQALKNKDKSLVAGEVHLETNVEEPAEELASALSGFDMEE